LSEPLKSRRAAREAAFQAVYQCVCGGSSIASAIDDALARRNFTPAATSFLREIAQGAVGDIATLDARYTPYLKSGWTPDRLSVVDRLILRLAVYELWSAADVPPKVTITQAVKLAKLYGSAESSGFINAVLAKVLLDSPKVEWVAGPEVVVGLEEEEEEESAEGQEQEQDREQEGSSWVLRSDE
jgi:N utilization substance protein B